jgi:hypothetical protein
LRDQLPSNIFVQMLAGPRGVRTGAIGVMLRLIAQISLVIGPVALLVFFQIQFLPYHPPSGIELWQRITVLLDLALLWLLWPSISRGIIIWTGVPRVTFAAAAIGTLIPILLAFTISTFPDEWLDQEFQSVPIVRNLHEKLFAGKADEVTGRPSSWFSNRLVLTDQSFVDPDKLETEDVSHPFRGRDLTYAILSRADLRKADFTGAKLNQAALGHAKLQGAHFGCATTGRGSGSCAELQGPSLGGAQLQGANLRYAGLQGVDLGGAQLQGVDLYLAQLQGVDLGGAQLQGANLQYAGLQGVDLRFAGLQGADLIAAHLQGADLDYAQLQGADVSRSEIQGASFGNVRAWRVIRERHSVLTSLRQIDFDRCDPNEKPWTDQGKERQSFTEWRDLIVKQIPVGELRNRAEHRLSRVDPNSKLKVINREICDSNGMPPRDEETTSELATFLADLACSNSSAPYVARGLLQNGRIWDTKSHVAAIVDKLRKGKSDPATCPGVVGFIDKDWTHLDELVQRASKQEGERKSKPTSKLQSTAQ